MGAGASTLPGYPAKQHGDAAYRAGDFVEAGLILQQFVYFT